MLVSLCMCAGDYFGDVEEPEKDSGAGQVTIAQESSCPTEGKDSLVVSKGCPVQPVQPVQPAQTTTEIGKKSHCALLPSIHPLQYSITHSVPGYPWDQRIWAAFRK